MCGGSTEFFDDAYSVNSSMMAQNRHVVGRSANCGSTSSPSEHLCSFPAEMKFSLKLGQCHKACSTVFRKQLFCPAWFSNPLPPTTAEGVGCSFSFVACTSLAVSSSFFCCSSSSGVKNDIRSRIDFVIPDPPSPSPPPSAFFPPPSASLSSFPSSLFTSVSSTTSPKVTPCVGSARAASEPTMPRSRDSDASDFSSSLAAGAGVQGEAPSDVTSWMSAANRTPPPAFAARRRLTPASRAPANLTSMRTEAGMVLWEVSHSVSLSPAFSTFFFLPKTSDFLGVRSRRSSSLPTRGLPGDASSKAEVGAQSELLQGEAAVLVAVAAVAVAPAGEPLASPVAATSADIF
eukprot:Rhum_TRINITY_DN14247_c19_g1::Rhum_TRINITY_DN14247_c19_g1_i1::g.77303::m.77303